MMRVMCVFRCMRIDEAKSENECIFPLPFFLTLVVDKVH